jgi:hypothetical protein
VVPAGTASWLSAIRNPYVVDYFKQSSAAWLAISGPTGLRG